MVCYKLVWKKQAVKELWNLEKSIIKKLMVLIEHLCENPRPKGCRKMKGQKNFYRIRYKNYRVIYKIEDKRLIIEIIKIGHRRSIYKLLK